MNSEKYEGRRVPDATLAFLQAGDLRTIETSAVYANEWAVTIGVPGAFTPICTEKHVPDFIRSAARLKKNGFSKLVCIAANDPFVVDDWARQLDPDH